jgi:hemerythrin superfamily protein
MSDAVEDRAKAAQLPEGDVIRILLEQHARIRELFSQVSAARGDQRTQLFHELRALLAVHETAEEMVLRPATRKTAGEEVADARMQEEAEANQVLAELEKLDLESPDFEQKFAAFEQAVSDHAESEESEEFPAILSGCDQDTRASMGRQLKAAESVAPTYPHPTAAGSTAKQWMMGPFASLVDRTRDAISKATG